jgi:hypothetical protein
MSSIVSDSLADSIAAAVEKYRRDDDVGSLFDRLKQIAAGSDTETLVEVAARFRDEPGVAIPLYERIVALRPNDAQPMVVLANAYWLTGRGPDVVGHLASKAIAIDPSNRGAWHLWALAESSVRDRVGRWQQVAQRFPADQLARAALADNATSLAGAEHDPWALDLAIGTYQSLLDESTHPDQRSALERTIATLRGWRL